MGQTRPVRWGVSDGLERRILDAVGSDRRFSLCCSFWSSLRPSMGPAIWTADLLTSITLRRCGLRLAVSSVWSSLPRMFGTCQSALHSFTHRCWIMFAHFFFFFLLYALILCENVFLPVWPAWSNSLKCYLLHGGGNVSHSTFSAATKSAVSSLTDVCYCHQYAEIMVQACALVKDQIVNGL